LILGGRVPPPPLPNGVLGGSLPSLNFSTPVSDPSCSQTGKALVLVQALSRPRWASHTRGKWSGFFYPREPAPAGCGNFLFFDRAWVDPRPVFRDSLRHPSRPRISAWFLALSLKLIFPSGCRVLLVRCLRFVTPNVPGADGQDVRGFDDPPSVPRHWDRTPLGGPLLFTLDAGPPAFPFPPRRGKTLSFLPPLVLFFDVVVFPDLPDRPFRFSI